MQENLKQNFGATSISNIRQTYIDDHTYTATAAITNSSGDPEQVRLCGTGPARIPPPLHFLGDQDLCQGGEKKVACMLCAVCGTTTLKTSQVHLGVRGVWSSSMALGKHASLVALVALHALRC